MTAPQRFSLGQRLVGLGLHATHEDSETMTFKRDEIEKFLNMVDLAMAPDPNEGRTVSVQMEISKGGFAFTTKSKATEHITD